MKVSSYPTETAIIEKFMNFLLGTDPLLKEIRSYKTIHGGGFVIQSKNKYGINEIKEIKSEMSWTFADVEDYNISAICEGIYSMAEEHRKQMHLMIFAGIELATQLTGNIVKSESKEFSAEFILDGLEKVEITFNDEGEPRLPQIMVGTEFLEKLKKLSFTPEQEERQKSIIDQKREKWNAKKRYRRLSYID